LGARRSPATGDASNAAAFAAAMASAGAMMGAWFAMRRRNKKS
ncbi:MAG: LPXTG cell wall anchor domain-containing protein, partial [Lachnospiraceae bacterium]|nr:LPXTG cell wall anchor domain-containing protein [Lachnospiraceae bacterium]